MSMEEGREGRGFEQRRGGGGKRKPRGKGEGGKNENGMEAGQAGKKEAENKLLADTVITPYLFQLPQNQPQCENIEIFLDFFNDRCCIHKVPTLSSPCA